MKNKRLSAYQKCFLFASTLLILCLIFPIDSYAAKKKVKLSVEKSKVEQISPDTIVISGKIDKKAKVKINNKEVDLKPNKKSKFKKKIKLDNLKNKVSIIAKRKGYKSKKVIVKFKLKDFNKQEREKNTFKDGTYSVGKDLPSGEYLVTSGKQLLENRKDFYFGNYAVYSDINKTTELYSGSVNVPIDGLTKDSLFNTAKFTKKDVNEYGSSLITLNNGEYIELDNTIIYPAKLREPNNPNSLIEGSYKVGRDIPIGTYKTEEYNPGGGETIHTLRTLKRTDEKLDPDNWIKSYQDYSDETYPDEITLKDGEYLEFSDMILSIK